MKVLGLLAIIGGVVILAGPFLLFFPGGITVGARFGGILSAAGIVAVALALHRRHATLAPALAWSATLAVILANVWGVALILSIVTSVDRGPVPPGSILFLAGTMEGLALSWFGVVVVRLGIARRGAAMAFAIGGLFSAVGSLSAYLGEGDFLSLLGALSWVSIPLLGIAMILLGSELRRQPNIKPGSGPVEP